MLKNVHFSSPLAFTLQSDYSYSSKINMSVMAFFRMLWIIVKGLSLFVVFFLIFIVIQLQLSSFSPQPNPPPSPTSTLPLDFVHVSFVVVPVNPSPHCPLPTRLWLYFVCFFLLLIMFQLKVRSYGICPSPPGLFHSA